MRYGIFSDVHSNLEALQACLSAYKEENIDKYLCIGDVVGYGANPGECIDKVRQISAFTCAGNHDWASVNLFSLEHFNPYAREAVIWTKDNLRESDRVFLESLKLVFIDSEITLVHGTLDHPNEFNYLTDAYIAEETFKLMSTNVCFVGHTHNPGVFSKDNKDHIYYRKESQMYLNETDRYVVNVGSVGQPRDGNPDAAFCIYDTEKRSMEIKRASYDIKTARSKIIDKGLPKFLGDRLISGR